MYLLIDGQALQVPTTRNRGVGRYSCNLVNALVKARPDWRIELVESTHMEPIDRDRVPGVATRAFRPLLPFAGASLDANERYFGDWLAAQAPDAILELSFFESPTLGLAPLFTGTRPRLFGILYDLIPLLFPRQYLNHGSWEYARRFRQLLSADGVLAISQAAADDLRAALPCLGLEIVNISGAPDPLLLPHAAEELEQFRETLRLRFGVEKPFLLSVVATDFRKNIDGILRGFAALPTSVRSQMELVIVCPLDDAQRSALEEKGRKLGLADSLRLPGFVNDNALSALYQLCRVFFFPSLYEGLGLPVLEALRCGAPVVTSNCSSLPEVAGPACWLADPNSPEDLARALLEALAEPRELRLAARLAHANTFHWPKTAESAARALEARPVFRPRRARLAWVSSLPPALTAGAKLSAALLPALSKRYELDLVVEAGQKAKVNGFSSSHAVLCPHEVSLRHEAAPYDLFVYMLENEGPLPFIPALFQRFPGLIVLPEGNPAGLDRQLLAGAKAIVLHAAGPWECKIRDYRGPVIRLSSLVHPPSEQHGSPFAPGASGNGDAMEMHSPSTLAEHYLAIVDLILVLQEAQDYHWVRQAVTALSRYGSPIDSAAIDSWAALRADGQFSSRKENKAASQDKLSRILEAA